MYMEALEKINSNAFLFVPTSIYLNVFKKLRLPTNEKNILSLIYKI
jgi:hypothetical protein